MRNRKWVFGVVAILEIAACKGKPKPAALSHEEALAETKRQCASFEQADKSAKLSCDQVADAIESIALPFAQVSNGGAIPDADEQDLETCMAALAAHTPRCRDHVRFKASLDRLVAAALR